MSLRHQLVVSLLVQGAGAASVLLATLLLGVGLGPEPQGAFSRTKAEIEFVSAFALFGLPQALFYFVRSGRLSGRAALRWAAGSALMALAIGAIYAVAQPLRAGGAWQAILAAAVGACVLQGQLRALLLARERTEWFNLVTALPQMLLLVGVLVLFGLGAADVPHWAWLFALAYGTAAALALWRCGGSVGERSPAGAVGWRDLGRYGLAAWLTAVLSSAAILLVQRWVEWTQGAAVLGLFTMALTLVQVPLTPVGYALPLLWRRWMEQPGWHASQRWAGVLFAALLAVAALVWLAAPWWPDLGLGSAYAGLAHALAVLLVGAAAEAVCRLLGVSANARGTPWVAARAEAARWAVLGMGWALPLPQGLLPVCAVWAAAALAAAAVLVLHARSEAASHEGLA